MFRGDSKKIEPPDWSEVIQDFFENCVLKRADSRVNLYVYLLLKTWNVCNFRSVWPNYFKFELYKVMDQNFEKNIFLNFLPPRGAPWGGRSKNFQNDWFLYQNSFQTILSNFWKKSEKKIFFIFFGSPGTPLELIFWKIFFAKGKKRSKIDFRRKPHIDIFKNEFLPAEKPLGGVAATPPH